MISKKKRSPLGFTRSIFFNFRHKIKVFSKNDSTPLLIARDWEWIQNIRSGVLKLFEMRPLSSCKQNPRPLKMPTKLKPYHTKII